MASKEKNLDIVFVLDQQIQTQTQLICSSRSLCYILPSIIRYCDFSW